MDDPRFVFWHSYEPGVASFGLAGVITEIGLAVFGADFAALQPDDRRGAVQNLLAEHRLLLIWDKLWTVRSMPDPAGATLPLEEALPGVPGLPGDKGRRVRGGTPGALPGGGALAGTSAGRFAGALR